MVRTVGNTNLFKHEFISVMLALGEASSRVVFSAHIDSSKCSCRFSFQLASMWTEEIGVGS